MLLSVEFGEIIKVRVYLKMNEIDSFFNIRICCYNLNFSNESLEKVLI